MKNKAILLLTILSINILPGTVSTLSQSEPKLPVHILSPPITPPGQGNGDSGGGQTIPWGVERINALEAEEEVDNSTAIEIQVAVLDTGMDYDHPDLQENILWGFDETKDSSNKRDWDDKNCHGTHCGGIIAAVDNSEGVIGVATNVKLYAIKVLGNSGRGSYQDIADGIIRAAKGPDGKEGNADDAEIISMSLGGSSDNSEVSNAVKYAYNHGTVLVAAAGNDGDGDPTTNEVSYPAKYPEVIAVAAKGKNDDTTSWSSEGSEVEVAAPGKDIYSTYKGGRYETMSGTSMACPHVAGLIALVRAEDLEDGSFDLVIGTYDSTSTSTIRGVVHDTCMDIETDSVDNYSGYGLVDAYAAVIYF